MAYRTLGAGMAQIVTPLIVGQLSDPCSRGWKVNGCVAGGWLRTRPYGLVAIFIAAVGVMATMANFFMIPDIRRAKDGTLTLNAARRVTARHAALEDAAFAGAVFEEVLSRSPTAAELNRCTEFLRDESRRLMETRGGPMLPPSAKPIAITTPAQRVRESLVLVLFNHNDFVTLR